MDLMMDDKDNCRPDIGRSEVASELVVSDDWCDNCWTAKQIELVHSNRLTFWYRSLKFFLHVHDYDPYAIFKVAPPSSPTNRLVTTPISYEEDETLSHSVARRQRFMLNHLESLRLPYTQTDVRRHKWTRFIRLFFYYYFVKCLLVAFTQYSLLKHLYLVPRGKQPPLLSLKQIEFIHGYLGNPLQALKDTSLLIYLGPGCLGFICFVYLPIYYKRHPLNVANLRFILNPMHELKRIDLNIKQKLDKIRLSLEVYKQQRHHFLLLNAKNGANKLPKFHLKSSRPSETSANCWSSIPTPRIQYEAAHRLVCLEFDYCRQIAGYLDQFQCRLQTLRPINFSSRYFEESSIKMSGLIVGAHFTYIICCIVLSISLEVAPYLERCEQRRAQFEARNQTLTGLCNPFHLYTWPEMLLLVEIPFVFILSYFTSSLNLALFSLVSSNQVDLVKSLKERVCESKKFVLQQHEAGMVARDLYQKKHSIGGSKGEKSLISLIEKHERNLDTRLRMDKQLLETLVKLMVCENELGDNASSISELAFHPFYYAGAIVFLAAVSGQINVPGSSTIRYFTCVVAYVNFNAVAISCAHVFSRILDFERLMWFLIAANAATGLLEASKDEAPEKKFRKLHAPRYEQLEDGFAQVRRPDEIRCCTFVADLWNKFAVASSLNIENYCVRPLRVKLTYEMIIELNFLVVFVYSLT